MSEPFDWGTAGTVIGAVGSIVGGIYMWMLKVSKDRANTRATVAEANTASTVADAQQTVYKLLTERLNALEGDMRRVRDELEAERRHGRRLAEHIWKLEAVMRSAGITPPPFVDEPA